jgi:amino acid transporter
MEQNAAEFGAFQRTIDWKQGLSIAIGVPLLILPSIGYFTQYMWSFSIIVWLLSIFQGFMQNVAYAELAAMFPEASGLPGFAQEVFKENRFGKYNVGKLLGGFSAWSYWFAWNAVLAIFSILIGEYLHGMLPIFSDIDVNVLSLLTGVVVFSGIITISYFGLAGGAVLGYVLSALSVIPLFVIAVVPLFNGNFHIGNITNFILPPEWHWADGRTILIFIGIMAMAEWSACGWETAAIYAPEYKDPKRDIPKALFYCGIICMITFFLVQTTCIGSLGVDKVIAEQISPMLLLAQQSFGETGALVTVFTLVASMILIIQTAFLGSSRAMHSMSKEGNLPPFFGATNKHGTPVVAMVITAAFNIALIMLKTPSAILSASAIGYVCANGISLFAYVRVCNKKFSHIARPYKAPKGWKYVALIFGLLNIPVYLVGIMYINALDAGFWPTVVGVGVLLTYLPLWSYTQNRQKIEEVDSGIEESFLGLEQQEETVAVDDSNRS